MPRLPIYDPRTIARDIPGIFESIFPQLTPGVVAHLNQTAQILDYKPIPLEMIQRSTLQHAMLFELGYAVGEDLLRGQAINWESLIQTATRRQREHFDAKIPAEISEIDKNIALRVGNNLASMSQDLANERGSEIDVAPKIPGLQWIASGNGDLSAGTTLIEVKCSRRNFAAADYRQLMIYWLLSFAASIETNSAAWSEGILLNPRSATLVAFQFDELLHTTSAGRTKVEILQLFAALIDTRDTL